MMDRREFTASLMALGALLPIEGEAQTAPQTAQAKPPAELKPLTSGIVKPGPVKNGQQGHSSQAFIAGLLSNGSIRVEMHESAQQPGAPHEAIGTHKHSEIWYVTKGVATLYIQGTEHRMETGEVGIVCAGDTHWIANAGTTELSYFVITVGPPE